MASDTSFTEQLSGYRLATAEIFYHLPDHPQLLQSYIWQDYDLAPKYPVLTKFLTFWRRELEGPLHSVRLAQKEIISAAEMRSVLEFGVQ